MKYTRAYTVLRKHSQQTLDFAVLICTAVPQLSHAFTEHEKDDTIFLATNTDFRFSHEPYSTEKRSISSYKRTLGANILLSTFSYFETYFFSAIDEIIEFHGGPDALVSLASSQVINKPISADTNERNLRYLREPHKSSASDRYRKYTRALSNEHVIWPTNRLILYGVTQMLENRKNWKSFKIPKLIRELLTMELADDIESKFHNLRDERNKIAHGATLSYDLKKAVDACIFFKTLAQNIDTHICNNFLVVEKYVR